MTRYQTILSWLCAVVLAGGLFGVAGCGTDSGGGSLEVIEPRLVKTQTGERSFTGTLVNPRPNAISIAQIEVALYDEDGSPVENIQIEVSDVPASDSLDFRQTIDSDQPFSQAQVQSVYTP